MTDGDDGLKAAASMAERVRASFARQGLMATYGATLTAVEEGACTITCPFSTGLSQQHGFFHAGVTAALADNAAGFAALSLFGDEEGVLSVEFKVNLLAPAAGELLIARGRVERAGKTITVARADVSVRRDGVDKPVAIALVTLMRVRHVVG